MKNVFIINAHEQYEFSKGELNHSLVEIAREHLTGAGYETQLTTMADEYDIDTEIERHRWADAVLLQTPVNWMGVPWSFKRYMDFVYSFGMDGRLCDGDGRTRKDPSRQYGSGGVLTDRKYMLSLTFNAPRESFDDPSQEFFAGKGVDDLFLPAHLNFRFFGMSSLPTFVCYDVMKNPDIENDFRRFRDHLGECFPGAS